MELRRFQFITDVADKPLTHEAANPEARQGYQEPYAPGEWCFTREGMEIEI